MTAGFQSALIAEKIDEPDGNGRADWKLHLPLVYLSEIIGLVTVPQGYRTDFASVPRMPFAYWLTGDTAHASAVVHDYLVRERIVSWKTAAKVFHEAMTVEGVPAWRRFLMYWAVRLARQY